MNNIINVLNNEGTLVVSSREVAENFDKRHDNVLKDIDNLISNMGCPQNLGNLFIETKYQQEQNKQWYKEYLLTRDGFSLLVMGFTGQKALEWKLKYIEAFNKMEQALQPKSIEDLIIMQAQSVKDLKNKMDKVEAITETLTHRIDNLDCINIEGTPRQRLNAIIKKYSFVHGINFNVSWHSFVQAFNRAYHTNLRRKVNYYKTKHGLKRLSIPDYLEKTNQLEDALRIAGKMLESEVA